MGVLDGLNACRRRAVNEVGLLFDAAAQYLGERDAARAEAERLRAQQPDAELVAHFDAPKESTPAQLAQERDLWRRHHENMRTITAALTEALDGEVAGWAGRPELYLAYQAACDATGRTAEPAPAHIAPEESETPAPGTPEWAASAPLDEVRAWLDGRGRRSVAPYRRVFGVCPACGGKLAPPDWTDTEWLRHGYRRCSSCRRLVVPARFGYIVEEATP